MSGFGGDQEGKAVQYIADGEKVLKKWTLFSTTTKNEDAAECFDKAARCYKVCPLCEGDVVTASPGFLGKRESTSRRGSFCFLV